MSNGAYVRLCWMHVCKSCEMRREVKPEEQLRVSVCLKRGLNHTYCRIRRDGGLVVVTFGSIFTWTCHTQPTMDAMTADSHRGTLAAVSLSSSGSLKLWTVCFCADVGQMLSGATPAWGRSGVMVIPAGIFSWNKQTQHVFSKRWFLESKLGNYLRCRCFLPFNNLP